MTGISWHEVTARLRFADYDALGHVNSLRLAEMVEHGRLTFLQTVPQRSDYEWTLAALSFEYKIQPNKMADFWVRSSVVKLGSSSFEMRHVVQQQDTIVVTARSILVQLDKTTSKSVPVESNQRPYLAC